MNERMMHFRGGPADGYTQLVDGDQPPYRIDMRTDTDGYYGILWDVAGQQVGDLVLTDDDVIAQWHQRSSADDFMTGDKVIIKATGIPALVFASTTQLNADGTKREGWTVAIDSNLTFVMADEIRIARPEELGNSA